MTNTNGKVTVSKEVAEILKQQHDNDLHESTVKYHAMEPEGWLEDAAPLNGLPLDTLIRALYIGYEVEKSPEEELAAYIKHCSDMAKVGDDLRGLPQFYYKAEGARKAAEILGVKLPVRTEAN